MHSNTEGGVRSVKIISDGGRVLVGLALLLGTIAIGLALNSLLEFLIAGLGVAGGAVFWSRKPPGTAGVAVVSALTLIVGLTLSFLNQRVIGHSAGASMIASIRDFPTVIQSALLVFALLLGMITPSRSAGRAGLAPLVVFATSLVGYLIGAMSLVLYFVYRHVEGLDLAAFALPYLLGYLMAGIALTVVSRRRFSRPSPGSEGT